MSVTRVALGVAALAVLALAPAASAAGCDVRVGTTCVVPSLCNTAAAPIHTADAALGDPLGGRPYCPVN